MQSLNSLSDEAMDFTGATIGGRVGSGAPVIGDNVRIGAGAKVLGGIRIGHHAQIVANAVVLRDVPDNHCGREPARIIRK